MLAAPSTTPPAPATPAIAAEAMPGVTPRR